MECCKYKKTTCKEVSFTSCFYNYCSLKLFTLTFKSLINSLIFSAELLILSPVVMNSPEIAATSSVLAASSLEIDVTLSIATIIVSDASLLSLDASEIWLILGIISSTDFVI